MYDVYVMYTCSVLAEDVSSSSKLGIILGCVFAGLALIIIVVGVLVHIFCYKKPTKVDRFKDDSSMEDTDSSAFVHGDSSTFDHEGGADTVTPRVYETDTAKPRVYETYTAKPRLYETDSVKPRSYPPR